MALAEQWELQARQKVGAGTFAGRCFVAVGAVAVAVAE